MNGWKGGSWSWKEIEYYWKECMDTVFKNYNANGRIYVCEEGKQNVDNEIEGITTMLWICDRDIKKANNQHH